MSQICQALSPANHSALPHLSTDHTHLHIIEPLISHDINTHTSQHSSVRSRSCEEDCHSYHSAMLATYRLLYLPAVFPPECVLQRSPVSLLLCSVPVCHLGEVCVQFPFQVFCRKKILKLTFLQIIQDLQDNHLPVSFLIALLFVNKYLSIHPSLCQRPTSVTDQYCHRSWMREWHDCKVEERLESIHCLVHKLELTVHN